ncbi:AfsR/SARP family transcriptional regulator [Kibdelosporangium aridum]|uniref:AfsR/SARP family transcriptional regulator n=1 Tax=Kibdelosporangium aridum TaxID=2030 RepID=A0A428ZS17_KIBAR|nr:BTAD domain-containing putative transcriptional regulator [Kibdelosporangium aridum]RSM90855.1 AfsR/SARP family transcriptional regulator [Kibdelosporangium aridum]
MRFGVLGPVAVWAADGTAIRVPELKVRALLAALLAREGQVVSADRLVEDLWGADPPAKAGAVLRSKVSQLRRALARDLVVHQAPGYLIRDAETDAQQFQEMVTRAQTLADPRERASLLGEALDLWRGPAYADFADEPFAQATITRLTEQRLTTLEDHAEARLALGEYTELADLIAEHPLRERLRAVYMRALYRAGRAGQALECFADLRKRLADELGVDPSPELSALHEAILRHDLAGNLPAPTSGLIGRDDAVAEIGRLLHSTRMVTLTGTGGVGKTRLAVETAARLTESFVDGVWQAELDAVGAPVEVVAAALGVRDSDAGPLLVRIGTALRHKRILLVLDNCEHVVDQVAVLANSLLKAAPGLKILATSREPLNVDGEHLWVVPPLAQADAVELFVARAAAAGSVIDDTDAVRVICARLDGIPLALELAATKVRALGVSQLAEQLDDRFQLLATGRRGAAPRQRTLRAMIDWSWQLLAEDERVLLRRLAIYSGGWPLDACPASPALLARLVDRSLVVVDDGPRYRLLESVAAYAMERLRESGEFDDVQRAHFEYFTRFAERADLRGHGQREWLRRLDAETANLHAALEGAVRQGNADMALRLANATAYYRYLRGRWGAAKRALDLALRVDGPAQAGNRAMAEVWRATGVSATHEALADIEDPVRRARAEWFLGFAMIGFVEHSVSGILAVFGEHDDHWGVAAALTSRAWNALARSDLASAAADAEQAVALFGEVGDDWGRMQAMDVLGEVAQISGDYPRAAALHQDGLRIAQELGLRSDVPYKLAQLGRIALASGDYRRADEFHEGSRRLAAEQSDKFGEQFAEVGLALAARRQGHLEQAEAHLDGWLHWAREVGWGPGVALVYAELGFIAELRGDAQTALDLHRAGYAAALDTGDPRAVALALEGMAGAHSLAGDLETAADLLQEANATREAAGVPLPPAERGDVDRISARLRA